MKTHRIGLLFAAVLAVAAISAIPGLAVEPLPDATPVLAVDSPVMAAPPDGASASLPPMAMVIAVLVPLVIAATKRVFPNIPGSALPVLAPVIGALLEYAITQLGLHGGGTLTGLVAGGAGVGLREIVHQNRPRSAGAVALLLLGCAPFLGGCTSFEVDQGDVSPERAITFKLRGRAWFSGQQAIAQLKAMQTDKTQSFGTDAISNRGPTNAVAVIDATTKLLQAARP